MSASESAQTLAFVLLVVFLAYVTAILVPVPASPSRCRGRPDDARLARVRRLPRRGRGDRRHARAGSAGTSPPPTSGWWTTRAPTAPVTSCAPRPTRWCTSSNVGCRMPAPARAPHSTPRTTHSGHGCRPGPRTTGSSSRSSTRTDDSPPNALAQAAGPTAFGDPRVGAAQAAVWMSNRTALRRAADGDDDGSGAGTAAPLSRWGRWLVRMQDIEFRTAIAAMQCLRGHTLSVGLGGNGQFTRLSTLDRIGAANGTPWHGSLLEDYELGVHVMLAGFRNVYLHDTHVEQEGLPRSDACSPSAPAGARAACSAPSTCRGSSPRATSTHARGDRGELLPHPALHPARGRAPVARRPDLDARSRHRLRRQRRRLGRRELVAAAARRRDRDRPVRDVAPDLPPPSRAGSPRGDRVALGARLLALHVPELRLRPAGVRPTGPGRAGWAKTRRNAESGSLLLATEA